MLFILRKIFFNVTSSIIVKILKKKISQILKNYNKIIKDIEIYKRNVQVFEQRLRNIQKKTENTRKKVEIEHNVYEIFFLQYQINKHKFLFLDFFSIYFLVNLNEKFNSKKFSFFIQINKSRQRQQFIN